MKGWAPGKGREDGDGEEGKGKERGSERKGKK